MAFPGAEIVQPMVDSMMPLVNIMDRGQWGFSLFDAGSWAYSVRFPPHPLLPCPPAPSLSIQQCGCIALEVECCIMQKRFHDRSPSLCSR